MAARMAMAHSNGNEADTEQEFPDVAAIPHPRQTGCCTHAGGADQNQQRVVQSSQAVRCLLAERSHKGNKGNASQA
jgi:hypothetical protein